MQKISKIFLFLMLAGAIFLRFSHAEELTTVQAALKDTFPESAATEKTSIRLSAEQLEELKTKAKITPDPLYDQEFIFYIVKDDKDILGYAFEDTVRGKWGPIHYFLALDPQGKVQNVVVLAYQEKRGRPVAEKRFIKQFLGKTSAEPVRLRKDIQGITGATISSRGMTDGVRKLLYVFEHFRKV